MRNEFSECIDTIKRHLDSLNVRQAKKLLVYLNYLLRYVK